MSHGRASSIRPTVCRPPLTLKLSEGSFQSSNCDLPSLVTKDEVLQKYRERQSRRWMEMPLNRQEAVSLDMEHGIKPDDCVITGYHYHPSAILHGGPCRTPRSSSRHVPWKGGSMHIFTPPFFGGNGIVGAHVPVGAGAAFAQMYRGEKACTFVMYGDGARHQGQVFEGVQHGNGPLILEFVTYRYGGHSMSDPGTTYYPIRGLQKYLGEWGVASEQELKAIDKEAKTVVDAAVENAKSSPEPSVKDIWSDIYYKGTEPEMMRRERRSSTATRHFTLLFYCIPRRRRFDCFPAFGLPESLLDSTVLADPYKTGSRNG
ncbi:mitochondrial pyruvate dehydrogenase E1 component beta subunit [Coprinopsis sp. MPI-PUGE-AT-0042]|nr:mitochondrial pyruvate dehydrogenase E1 component beta subunit [Coprinopsis sp. MPI-PUGE-AT-0042]